MPIPGICFTRAIRNATGTEAAWTNAGTDFKFAANGKLTSPARIVDHAGQRRPSARQSLGNVSLNVGSGGLTQYSSTSGTATINTISQNGYAAGQLQSVAVNDMRALWSARSRTGRTSISRR